MGLKKKRIIAALAGNPNSGKSTIFNNLTGSKQHVGNYPGVTVEKKVGKCHYGDYEIIIYDLPGIYSLTAYSEEEKIARDFLLIEKPDIVIDIIDSSNLERNLYLLMQLLEMNLNTIAAFNMSDELKHLGIDISLESLNEELKIPIVRTVGHRAKGMRELLDSIIRSYESNETCNSSIRYSSTFENFINKIQRIIERYQIDAKRFPVRWLSISLLEDDPYTIELLRKEDYLSDRFFSDIAEVKEKESMYFNEEPEIITANERYDYITNICKNAVTRSQRVPENLSDKIDKIITNRLIGLPIFFLMMFFVFQITFSIGEYPMRLLEDFFSYLGDLVTFYWPFPSLDFLRALIVDGIIGGVGGVLIFLPILVVLFLSIAVLEDSGYMARAAYIMDKVMKFIGLEGRSFVPILIGFGCTVPAIMATRSLKSFKERVTTILILPLISCGARFPIYAIIIASFFPKHLGAPLLWAIYVFGIILAVFMAKILRSTLLKGVGSPFILELPPYRWPTMKGLFFHTWLRSFSYLKKAGSIILLISIVLWFFNTYPKLDREEFDPEEGVSYEMKALEHSLSGRIGKTVEPVFKPIGFDWKIVTGFIGAFAAKEIFIAQMSIIHSIEETEESPSLRHTLKKNYSSLQGLVIMLFALIATPCIATVAVTRQETGFWKWAFLQWGGLTALAYIISLIIYQAGGLLL